MKKALFFLSLVFSLLLAGGCAKEPLNLEGTRWSRINDGFGGFEYSRYDLSFSSGGEVVLEIYSGSTVSKTVKGTYTYQKKQSEAQLSGLEWEETKNNNTYIFRNSYLGTQNKNKLWVEVEGTYGSFSISFDPA